MKRRSRRRGPNPVARALRRPGGPFRKRVRRDRRRYSRKAWRRDREE